MTVDYPPAIDMINSNPNYVFIDALTDVPASDLTLMIHKTASGGPTSARAIAQYFHNNASRVTSHFVVGKDGSVIQVVRLKDGAGANCCTTAGYNQAYWGRLLARYGNLNLCTISIEHVDETRDNSDPMPEAQIQASFQLIAWLCARYRIPVTQIQTHASVDPVNRSRCPGSTYPFERLYAYLKGGTQMRIPDGWGDDGEYLIAPNKIRTHGAIRRFILSRSNWDAGNVPLEEMRYVERTQQYWPSGPGWVQIFNYCLIICEKATGRAEIVGIGNELLGCQRELEEAKKSRDAALEREALAQAQVARLENQLAAIHSDQETQSDLQRFGLAVQTMTAIAEKYRNLV